AATSETVYYNPDNLMGGLTEVNSNGATTWFGDVTAEYRLPGDFVVNGLAVAGRDESFAIQNNGTLNPSSAYLALNGTTNTSGSPTQISIPGTSVAVTQALTPSNALDIWGQGASNQTSPAVLAALADNRSLTRNIASFQQARASLNGTIFPLPGGDVK